MLTVRLRRTRVCQLSGFWLAAPLLLLGGTIVPAAGQVPSDAEAAWRAVVEEWRGDLEAGGVVGASLALVHRSRGVQIREACRFVCDQLAPQAGFIPEIWQGHKNNGEGFWIALDRLERWF